MTRVQVRRLPVVAESGSDYTSVFEFSPAPVATPERWARAVFEDAPAVCRIALRTGWRLGLRLRLSRSPGPDRVLGWPVTESGPTTVALTADGPLMTARNRVDRRDDAIAWTTTVRFKSRTGRLVWGITAPIHHLTIPWLLRRAARRITSGR